MTHAAGFADAFVTWLLVLFGLGLVVGNLVGGRYADRAPMPMLCVSLGALAVVLALFYPHHPRQGRRGRDHHAGRHPGLRHRAAVAEARPRPGQGAPTLASAVNIGAFNLGNALAAWLGGLVIDAGFSYTAPNWVGALLAVSTLVPAFLSAALERRGNVPSAVVADGTMADRRAAVRR
jgi:MFS transporter, DHA1 family, inner membrane transport protein